MVNSQFLSKLEDVAEQVSGGREGSVISTFI